MIAGTFPHAQAGAGLIGGLMIGLAAAIMLLGLGRIAGVSGLAARAAGLSHSGAYGIAAAFVLGLPLGAFIVATLAGGIPATFPAPSLLVVAGVIVGFGTRLGSGCTSGHGVCGVSRLSRRSILATGLFMASGFATVAVMRFAGAL
ncbi:YeeE/YedE family protein [Novosphingobium sp. BL-52-GroH]|uniref:YeeE/YedE family protein n=1 Tax=Novosphingobium sp. BL-52-GroH TaxID=3349877 RepID=UPI00384F4852